MKIQAVDKQGNVHKGSNIKNFLITEENGAPLVIVRESIIGGLINYNILTPGDDEFTQAARGLGYDIQVTKVK